MRRVLCCLVVGALLALTLLTASASAARLRLKDPTGDVRAKTYPGTGAGPTHSAARKAGPDITALQVLHGPETVRLKLTFAALSRPGAGDQMTAQFWVVGARAATRKRFWVTSSHAGSGRGPSSAMGRASERVRAVCPKAVEVEWDFAADTVVAVVPRRCLGDPGRIRVAAGLAVAEASRTARHRYPFDNALRAGGTLGEVRETFSPWVRAG